MPAYAFIGLGNLKGYFSASTNTVNSGGAQYTTALDDSGYANSSLGTAQTGDYFETVTATSTGSIGGRTDYAVLDWVVWDGSAWDRISNADKISSVILGSVKPDPLKITGSIEISDESNNMYMFISSSNATASVGIGTVSPGAPLHLYKAAASANPNPLEILRLESQDEGVDMDAGHGPGIDFYVGETGGSNYGGTVAVVREAASDADSSAAIVFHTATDDEGPGSDREKMRITSAGLVGIGDTSPSYTLDVDGTLRSTGNALFDANVTLGNAATDVTTVTGRFTGSNGAYVTGDVGLGTSSPGAPLHVYKAAVGGTPTHLEILRLESQDEGVDMDAGHGPGIDFYVGETGGSNYGGTVAVVREAAGDADSSAAIVFHTATDDQGPSNTREKMRITSAGLVGIGDTSPSYTLDVDGTLRSTGNALFDANVTLGDAAADTITVNGFLTASNGVEIRGTMSDALRVTGSAIFNGDVTLGNAATDTITVNGDLTASNGMLIPDDVFLTFGTDADATIEYDEDGTDQLRIAGDVIIDAKLTASNGMLIPDDTSLTFGTGADATIEYDENGTDELRFAGAAVTFEQAVTFDGNVTLGDAATDVTTITGKLTASNGATIAGDVLPSADNAHDLGSATARWANVYAGDLHLKNDRGDWTIIEEADYLSLTNNATGKRYRFVLAEIDE